MTETNNKPHTAADTSLKWIRIKETPDYYINAIHATWTASDVRFRVGKIVPQGEQMPFTFAIQEEAAMTIAWSQMKSLRDIITNLIETYEKTNGEIKTPSLPLEAQPK